MSIRQITLLEAEFIALTVARELMGPSSEPIPPFSTREPGKLESSLAEPFTTYDGKYLHRTFLERAAVLFYLITKNHCFANGNKRMAVTLTMVFFFVNKRWISIPPVELYRIAKRVAESEPTPMARKAMQTSLIAIFKKYQVPFPPYQN